jgi:hypothetical protein
MIEALIQTGDDVQPSDDGSLHTITARLILPDSTVLEDTKPCAVVEPPPPDHETGDKRLPEPNYRIIEVWREPPADQPRASTWEVFGWDKDSVGKYNLTTDEAGNDLLLLYINMDNEDLRRERERRLRTARVAATVRMDARYKAYIGYHLWLHSQQHSRVPESVEVLPGETGPAESSQEDAILHQEMRRVSKTVLLAMRSEADLLRVTDPPAAAAVDRNNPLGV